MQISVTLAQARTLYEDHFGIKLPGKLPFSIAAQAVMTDLGPDEFMNRFNELNLDGSYRRYCSNYDCETQEVGSGSKCKACGSDTYTAIDYLSDPI